MKKSEVKSCLANLILDTIKNYKLEEMFADINCDLEENQKEINNDNLWDANYEFIEKEFAEILAEVESCLSSMQSSGS